MENAIHTDKRVQECAAVALPDPVVGERVGVVVVLREGAKATGDELIEVARPHLSRHEVPALVIIQKEALARNANGKIVKKELAGPIREKWAAMSKAKL